MYRYCLCASVCVWLEARANSMTLRKGSSIGMSPGRMKSHVKWHRLCKARVVDGPEGLSQWLPVCGQKPKSTFNPEPPRVEGKSTGGYLKPDP